MGSKKDEKYRHLWINYKFIADFSEMVVNQALDE